MNIIKPLNKRVLVEPEDKGLVTEQTKAGKVTGKVSAGGILIPETPDNKQKVPTKGTVISISEDSEIKLKVAPGDLVIFHKYAGTEVIIPSKEMNKPDRLLYLMKDDDILAVIETDK